MTDRELMQQALEAMEDIFGKNKIDVGVINRLRDRLAQPEQELVCVCGAIWEGQELVSSPTQRKPLTDEMVKRMKEVCTSMEMRGAFADGWLSAEAAHGIKGEA